MAKTRVTKRVRISVSIVEALHPYSLQTAVLTCPTCNDSTDCVSDTETGRWLCSGCLRDVEDHPIYF